MCATASLCFLNIHTLLDSAYFGLYQVVFDRGIRSVPLLIPGRGRSLPQFGKPVQH